MTGIVSPHLSVTAPAPPVAQAYHAPATWGLVWVAVLLLVSMGLPVWHRYGMDETLRFDASTHYQWLSAYDDRGLGGHSVATLTRQGDSLVFQCQIKPGYAWPYCSFSAIIAKGNDGYNLSRYQTARFDIRAHGPMAVPIRIYLRNFDPAYSKTGDTPTLKVNTLQYVPDDKGTAFQVPLANFQVASWWIQQFHIPIHQATPDLRNVTVFDVSTGDGMIPGDYEIRIHSITFYGKWLSEVQLLTIILALWLISAMLYLIGSLVMMRRSALLAANHNHVLLGVNAALELEREELANTASHDELTGALNRIGMRNRLYELMAPPRANDTVLSILFMDIDHFKHVNDTFGHVVGDAVLKQFATTITHNTRTVDMFCRWGGEEFVLVCEGLPCDGATRLALKLCSVVAEASWPEGIPLRSSFGVAQLNGADESISALLERADQALYAAKQAGRARVGVSTRQGITIHCMDRV